MAARVINKTERGSSSSVVLESQHLISKKSSLHQFSESCPFCIVFKQSECWNTDPFCYLCTFSGGEVNLSGAVACHQGRFHHRLSSLRKKSTFGILLSFFVSCLLCLSLIFTGTFFMVAWQWGRGQGFAPVGSFLSLGSSHAESLVLIDLTSRPLWKRMTSDISDVINNTFLYFFYCGEK